MASEFGRGRPKKGEIRDEFLGLSPEEQMQRDQEIEKLAPQDGFRPFTYALAHELSRMKPKVREGALQGLAQVEWDRCAKDIFYWLDKRRHAMPYVKTIDPRTNYICNECEEEKERLIEKGSLDPEAESPAWSQFNLMKHQENRHGINLIGQETDEILKYYTPLAPIRPWTMKPYFAPIVKAWLTYPFICMPKSRDMMATWLATTMFTWNTLFKEGQQFVFQSDDTMKTRELVEDRSWFIFQHQPKFLQQVHPAKFEVGLSKGGRLHVPSIKSEIIGLAQGSDQIRYLHPAGIFIDEGAFHNQLEQTIGAVKPAIQKGGRITIVSSANPGFFQALVQDFSQ